MSIFFFMVNNPFSGFVLGSDRVVPTLADIDGDGDLDVLAGGTFGPLQFLRNAGTATAPAYVRQTDHPYQASIALGGDNAPLFGDIDGDGDFDLLIGAGLGRLTYFRNDGNATNPTSVLISGTSNPFSAIDVGENSVPSLGDVDGDGDLDLLIGAGSGMLHFFRNTGTATAPAFASQTGAANPFDGITVGSAAAPSLGDIDQDGDLDLVLGETSGKLHYYRNTGTATAPAFAPQTGTANPFGAVDVELNSVPRLADIDADGDLDLVIAQLSADLIVFQNPHANPAPVFAALTGTANPFNGADVGQYSSPRWGDIDQDGDLDLIVGEFDGFLNIYRNTGTATAPAFAALTGTSNPLSSVDVGFFSAPTWGDLDADGDLDLVVGANASRLLYYRNSGTALVAAYVQQTSSNNPFDGFGVGFNDSPSLGDIDGDGDLDLVVGGIDGTLRYYGNTGSAPQPAYGLLSGTNSPFTGVGLGSYSTPSVGDVDGDGDLDLVVGEGGGTLRYFQNTGTATTPAYVERLGANNPFNGFSAGSRSTPNLGDIDGDGDLDLTVGRDDGTVLTFIHNDAPTLRHATFDLTATNEDTDSTPVTVASLLASAGWADVDLRAPQALAITGSTGAGWQYSVNGTTWSPVGTASATAAVLLGAGTQLRYAPDRINGETATLSFRAWDQSSGTASTDSSRSTADTTTNGGSTAFSVDSSTASLLVSAVNDRPVAVNDTFTTNEDTVLFGNVLAANPNTADSDPDGGVLSVIAINGSSANVGVAIPDPLGRGTILLQADGTLTVDPRGAYDSFTSSGRGLFTISYTVSDGQGGTSVGNIDITVLGANDAPTTTPVALAPIDEDSDALTITQAMLLRNAGDLDFAAVLTATGLTKTGGNGTLSDLGGGQWSYLPAANDDTDVSFSYTISDGTDTVAGSATLDITPVNDAPVLSNDLRTSVLTWEDSNAVPLSLDFLLPSFLSLWSDVDSGAQRGVAVVSVSGASQWEYSLDGSTWLTVGTVSETSALLLGDTAQVRYSPDGKNGEVAELSYRAWDQTSGIASAGTTRSTADTSSNGGTTAFSSKVAPVVVTIQSVNDAPTTTPVTLLPAMLEDSGTRTITQAQLLANAADVDLPAQALSVSNLQLTGNGTLDNNNNGTWTFTLAPNDDTDVSFSYTISDGTDTVAGSATLDILPVNDAPTTTPVTLGSVQEDSAGRLITQALLLANAVDLDRPAQTLTASNLQLTGNGTLTNLGGGSWSFRPAPNDDTDVSFSYTISDGTDTVAGSATLDILPINDFPTNSGPVTLTAVLEDSPTFELPKADLLRNARDVDSSLSVASLQLVFPSQGSVSYDAQGDRWLYTPAADDDTEVVFSYLGFDGLWSVPVRATLDLLPVNDAPTTRPVTLTPINEDTTVTITPALLLANAADVDRPAQTLTVSNLQLTGGGTLQDNPDGTWSYTPAPNDDTGVSFSYTISDGTDTVAGSGTLDIVPVNDAPTTAPVTLDAIQEDSTALLITQQMLLANAADLDLPAQALSVSNLQLTGNGTLVNNNNGTWSYTPALNDDTGVSFSYNISDGSATVGGSATLDILPVNDAPTTRPVTLPPMAENSGTRTITQTMLLMNAGDVDGPTPKAEDLRIVDGLGGLVDNGDGTWNYTPAPNDDTGVRFSYRVSDGTLSVAGSATLDITPVNQAPVAVNDSAQTSLNTGVNIAVLANDTDIDGLLLRVSATSPGSNGTVVIRPDGVSVRYTPNNGFSGFDNFTYAVSDGAGGSATASVRVVVASITGSNGNDTLLGTQQADFVLGQDGADRILTHDGADYVDAGRGADTITGGAGADTLLGGDGPDIFLATSAELAGDEIDGGDGTDTLVITNAPASLPANFSFTNLEQISFTGALLVEHTSLLDLSSLTLASGSSNSIIGGTANSRITGTASADNIVDSAGNDVLRGAAGNDTITGGFGQDTLNGGTGNDVLYGGSATAPNDFVRDIFVFNTPLNAATNVDQIIGFQANSQDQIQLSGSIFAAITGGASSGLDAGEFLSVNGGNALDGNDFILFDPATGNLFYDADGNGPGAKVLFATLMGLTGTLDATDFSVTGTP